MNMPKQPFVIAERYLQLRRIINSPSWAETTTRMSDMIIMPFIAVFLFFLRKADPMMVVSVGVKAYQSWKQWFDFHDLRLQVQMMFLHTQASGGPIISTNNMEYMPYVFAHSCERNNIIGKGV